MPADPRPRRDVTYRDRFGGPFYTSETDTNAGGKKSTGIIGPGMYNLYQKTDANSALPGGIKTARTHYSKSFKAGHLLNARFGGNGQDSKNLTILTPGANTRMQAFDNNVDRALFYLRKVYEKLSENYVKISNIQYGIYITVTVGEEKWGPDKPASYIAKRITCTAKTHNYLPALESLQYVENFNGRIADAKYTDIEELKREVESYLNIANGNGTINNEI